MPIRAVPSALPSLVIGEPTKNQIGIFAQLRNVLSFGTRIEAEGKHCVHMDLKRVFEQFEFGPKSTFGNNSCSALKSFKYFSGPKLRRDIILKVH